MFKVQCSAFDVPGSGFEFMDFLGVLGVLAVELPLECYISAPNPPFFRLWTVNWRPWTGENPLKTLAKSVSIRVHPWLKRPPEKMFKKTLKNI
jgi:hypothetical protein